MKTGTKKLEQKSVIQKILDDKRAIRKYINTHGTLKGFKSDTIKFARPF